MLLAPPNNSKLAKKKETEQINTIPKTDARLFGVDVEKNTLIPDFRLGC